MTIYSWFGTIAKHIIRQILGFTKPHKSLKEHSERWLVIISPTWESTFQQNNNQLKSQITLLVTIHWVKRNMKTLHIETSWGFVKSLVFCRVRILRRSWRRYKRSVQMHIKRLQRGNVKCWWMIWILVFSMRSSVTSRTWIKVPYWTLCRCRLMKNRR